MLRSLRSSPVPSTIFSSSPARLNAPARRAVGRSIGLASIIVALTVGEDTADEVDPDLW